MLYTTQISGVIHPCRGHHWSCTTRPLCLWYCSLRNMRLGIHTHTFLTLNLLIYKREGGDGDSSKVLKIGTSKIAVKWMTFGTKSWICEGKLYDFLWPQMTCDKYTLPNLSRTNDGVKCHPRVLFCKLCKVKRTCLS